MISPQGTMTTLNPQIKAKMTGAFILPRNTGSTPYFTPSSADAMCAYVNFDTTVPGPQALALDKNGNKYFVSNKYSIYKIDISGNCNLFTNSYTDSSGNTVIFSSLFRSIPGNPNPLINLVIDSLDNLFCCNNTTIFKITPQKVATIYLHGFNYLSALTVDSTGNLFVIDLSAIKKISTQKVVTVIAGGTTANNTYSIKSTMYDGIGTNARFDTPKGITIDLSGNLYVCDNTKIRMISPSGLVTTISGHIQLDYGSTMPYGINNPSIGGQGTLAKYYNPTNIAVDPFGNIFVSGKLGIMKIVYYE